jgi:hypothetical protein
MEQAIRGSYSSFCCEQTKKIVTGLQLEIFQQGLHSLPQQMSCFRRSSCSKSMTRSGERTYGMHSIYLNRNISCQSCKTYPFEFQQQGAS